MTMRTLVGVAVCGATLALAACGGHSRPMLTGRAVTPAQWKAVLRDWYDGRISDHHSCGAVVVASEHLPVDGPIYGTLAGDLSRYAAKVCTHHPDLAAVRVGMADADVAAVAGAPQVPLYGSCWDYREPRGTRTEVCFRLGRVVSRSGSASCDLAQLRATAGLQGATGSQLGGITVANPGPSCTLTGGPTVELDWHGRRVTPPQAAFAAGALRSMSPFRPSRRLAHGATLFIRVQWWNYCGPAPWGRGSFRPVAVIRVYGAPGSLTARFIEAVVPPFCNSRRDARFSVSDFGTSS